ncbi:ABC transporter permease [Emticicia oligotrophica]|uniref:ABC transporter permease n=1 Tax=Emticicia oligotrophica TaxID=312279 RepID=UPI00273C6E4C|nr:ABC transporter permease [Emticicia oligotrophica]
MLKEAFKFMWYDKTKMFGILFGIILSVFLIGQQIGICFSLLNSTISLAKFNQNYIWVVSDKSQQVSDLPLLDMRIYRELMSINGVKKVNQLIVGGGSAKFSNGTKTSITMIGTQAPSYAGGPWKFAFGNLQDLQQEGAVIGDSYDPIQGKNIKIGDHFEYNGNRVVLIGQTKGAKGLGVAYGFTTVDRARKLCKIPTTKASAFLVEWENGASVEQVIRAINKEIPGVKARDGKTFTNESLKYFALNSGIVASFGLLVVFAIITGFAIVGLTMFSAVNDRIKDYGTIKAIGGTNGVIRNLILWQATIYSIVGFAVAYFLLFGFVQATKKNLDIQITPELTAFLIIITLIIAVLGSLLAMRKITKLEPAAVFRS